MTNALYWARAIKAEGVVRSATGDGRIPFIHPEDIADVATAALTTREHDGASLGDHRPGGAELRRDDREDRRRASGSRSGSRTMSEEDARRQQVAWSTPAPMVEARLSIFRAIREGRLAAVTGEVERVLGRRPIRFDAWAEQNAAAFR